MEILKMKQKITIDIVSDVACPWCYIGKNRLENAINKTGDEFDFEVNFKPFQLDPTIPKEGLDRKTYFANKFGSDERVEEIYHRVESAGHSVGVDFKFREIPKAINTLPLHILLKSAEKEGFQQELAKAFFEAYMVKPQDLSNPLTIVNILKTFGWEENKTLELMNNEALAYEIKNEIAHYQQLGVSGVPFFIINNKYGISGAQPSESFISAFKSLNSEDFPVTSVDACDIDGKNC
jgi:predicted DsbA family dithiol-disulfide isomerase